MRFILSVAVSLALVLARLGPSLALPFPPIGAWDGLRHSVSSLNLPSRPPGLPRPRPSSSSSSSSSRSSSSSSEDSLHLSDSPPRYVTTSLPNPSSDLSRPASWSKNQLGSSSGSTVSAPNLDPPPTGLSLTRSRSTDHSRRIEGWNSDPLGTPPRSSLYIPSSSSPSALSKAMADSPRGFPALQEGTGEERSVRAFQKELRDDFAAHKLSRSFKVDEEKRRLDEVERMRVQTRRSRVDQGLGGSVGRQKAEAELKKLMARLPDPSPLPDALQLQLKQHQQLQGKKGGKHKLPRILTWSVPPRSRLGEGGGASEARRATSAGPATALQP